MTIEDAFGRYLRNECPELSALVANRIYNVQPPAKVTFPLLLYRLSSETYLAETLTDQGELIRASFEVVAMSETSQEQAGNIATVAQASLVGTTGRFPSTDGDWSVSKPIRRVNKEQMSSDKLTEQGLYAVALSFDVTAKPYTI